MVRKHLSLFDVLVQSTDKQREVFLKTVSETQLKAILEAIYNVLFGTCSINTKDKRKLKPHSAVIRRMLSKELTLKQQRRLLKKHQHLLPLLLKPVIDMFRKR